MNRIIFIYVVLMAIHSNKWITEANSVLLKRLSTMSPEPMCPGATARRVFPVVCGSDGVTYHAIYDLECAQIKGKNVIFLHNFECYPWEKIGISLKNIFVSEF